MDRTNRLISFGVGIVVALLAVTFFMADSLTTTNAAGGGPEMALTISSGGTCSDGACTVPSGGSFTLDVQVIEAPADYVLVQSFTVYPDIVEYQPSAANADEVVWPECNTSVALRQNVGGTSWLHGCTTGVLPPLPVSNYTGTIYQLAVDCVSDGTGDIQLLPNGAPGALTNGAVFSLGTGQQIIPKVSDLTVTCGEGGGSPTTPPVETTEVPTTPTATTPTATTPTNTPVTPTATTPPVTGCGDVNDDGAITSTDALWVLWYTAQLVDSLPNTGDINGDGMTDSRDATLILQYTADLLNSLSC